MTAIVDVQNNFATPSNSQQPFNPHDQHLNNQHPQDQHLNNNNQQPFNPQAFGPVVASGRASQGSHQFLQNGYVYEAAVFYVDTNSMYLPFQQPGFAPPLPCQGNVWRWAQDKIGCRWIQQILRDEATSDNERRQVAQELHTHAWEASRCPNANHVLQACIDTMRPADFQFIVDEILQKGEGSVLKVARHQYGCRVLQRLLKHAGSDEVVEQLLEGAAEICTQQYAQFVLQHLCEHGTEQQVTKLAEILAQNITIAGAHSFGCAVLSKALDHACKEARTSLAHALLLQTDLLLRMSSSRYGQLTVLAALQVAESFQRAEALSTLLSHEDTLMQSRYGRVLSKQLDTFMKNN